MEPYEPHLALLTALAVGALIGLEREQAKDKGPGGAFAGIRTYPIFSLIGAVAMLLESASIWLPLIALGGVIALVVVHYSNDVKRDAAHGVTTEVSVIATYLLGALAAPSSAGAVPAVVPSSIPNGATHIAVIGGSRPGTAGTAPSMPT